jgi:hypothetical protein
MNRSDLPYVVLTFVFGLAIFVAGRMSAPVPAAPEPRVIVVHDAMPAPPPSVVVVASSEPPMALLPEMPAPSVSAPVIKAPKAPVAAPKQDTVILEETPAVPANPYRPNTPSF